jgi:excisionase family DNA binding protein
MSESRFESHPKLTDESPWLSAAEAAQRAGVGKRLIYREIRAGRLRAAVIGRRRELRLLVDWVDAWLEASARPLSTGRAS